MELCLVSSPNSALPAAVGQVMRLFRPSQTCGQEETQEALAEDADWRARALSFLGEAEAEDKEDKKKRKELKRITSGDWIMAVDRSLQASVGKGLSFWSSLPPLDDCKPEHRRRAGPLEARQGVISPSTPLCDLGRSGLSHSPLQVRLMKHSGDKSRPWFPATLGESRFLLTVGGCKRHRPRPSGSVAPHLCG